ncbi:MAG TPA: hypothetical protein VEF76_12815 [Patescibacteria group bacterium]|nr:hypothetical protein [Patescibacteria group bacterium]
MALKRVKKLAKTFAIAAGGLLMAGGVAYLGVHEAAYAGRGEKLTAGETQAVHQIFGDQVDASKIRKHFKEQDDWTHFFPWVQGTVLPPFSHIDFFTPGAWSKDYSQDRRSQYGFFLHEVTHVWQGQHMRFSHHAIGRYDYALLPGARFGQFGTEQQAQLIEHYAERWIHPEGRRLAKSDDDRILRDVVESQFPQAKITRETLDRQDAARAQAPKPPRAA